MKDNLRRLQLFLKISKIHPHLFYSITINDYGVSLQGKYYSPLVKELNNSNWRNSIDNNGYVEFNKKKITITLT